MTRFPLFVFFLLLNSVVLAGTSGKEFDVLLSQLNAISELDTRFSQKTLSADGSELQRFTGKMKLVKPGKFFWQADEPNPQLLISNGQTIWHYDEDLEQVIVQSYAKQKNEAPLLLILQNSDVLKQNFSLENVIKKGEKSIYELKANNGKAGLVFLLLQFEKGLLSHIAFVDQLNQRTEVMLSHEATVDINPAIFNFIIPEGVDVLYE